MATVLDGGESGGRSELPGDKAVEMVERAVQKRQIAREREAARKREVRRIRNRVRLIYVPLGGFVTLTLFQLAQWYITLDFFYLFVDHAGRFGSLTFFCFGAVVGLVWSDDKVEILIEERGLDKPQQEDTGW